MQLVSFPSNNSTDPNLTWDVEYLVRGEDDEVTLFGIIVNIRGQIQRYANLNQEKFRNVCLKEGIDFNEAWSLIFDHPDKNF